MNISKSTFRRTAATAITAAALLSTAVPVSPRSEAIRNRVLQTETNSYKDLGIRSGVILWDSTKCIEIVARATPMDFVPKDNKKATVWGIDEVVTGRTDKDRTYQIALEFNHSSGFQISMQEFQNNKAISVASRQDFPCMAFDRIDLELSINDGVVKLAARDLDNEAVAPVTIVLPAVGEVFVGQQGKDVIGSSIFTEIQSGSLNPPIPKVDYRIVQPTNITKLEFFMDKISYIPSSTKDFNDETCDYSVRANSGWIYADKIDKSGPQISTNGVTVWANGKYDFSTFGKDGFNYP